MRYKVLKDFKLDWTSLIVLSFFLVQSVHVRVRVGSIETFSDNEISVVDLIVVTSWSHVIRAATRLRIKGDNLGIQRSMRDTVDWWHSQFRHHAHSIIFIVQLLLLITWVVLRLVVNNNMLVDSFTFQFFDKGFRNNRLRIAAPILDDDYLGDGSALWRLEWLLFPTRIKACIMRAPFWLHRRWLVELRSVCVLFDLAQEVLCRYELSLCDLTASTIGQSLLQKLLCWIVAVCWVC